MDNHRGFFLILVAAVVAALAAILVQFGVDAQLGTLTAGNFRDETLARQEAKSVLAGVKVAIASDRWRDPGLIPLIAEKVCQEGTCDGVISNEEGKLPVNRLVGAGMSGIEILRRYWDLRGGSPGSFHALVDWIDADERTVTGESEASFYGKLGVLPGNRPLQSIFELSRIPYVKEEVERLKKIKAPPLRRDLTTWGDGRVNLLTASRDVLMALSEGMTPALADRILAARELGQIQTMGDFNRVLHVPAAVFQDLARWGTTRSRTFCVQIRVTYRKARAGLWAVLRRTGLVVRILYFREGSWQPA